MSRTLTLAQLAEGITRQHVVAGDRKMVDRWNGTGLLDGLSGTGKEKMARLLENQLVEVMRGPTSQHVLNEANVLSTGGAGLASSGQMAGFTSVAFPIVRRVFAGLLANELVSVQPMNLPSGLLFYIDYAYGSNVGGDAGVNLSSTSANETYTKGNSVYTNPTGASIRTGGLATGGQYNLVGTGFSKIHKQALNVIAPTDSVGYWLSGSTWTTGTTATVKSSADFTGLNARYVSFDSQVELDLTNNVLDYCFVFLSASEVTTKIVGSDVATGEGVAQVAITGLGGTPGGATSWGDKYQGGTGVMNLRKETRRGNWNPVTGIFEASAQTGTHLMFVVALSNTGNAPTLGNATTNAVTASATIVDSLTANSDGSTLTIPSFESDFAVDSSPKIPEVEIKMESVAVTATTRKLRARWSPEMAQDVNAYYNIDIEGELTNLLSEMISLDIDREILNDLLAQASAANYYWSKAPGKFVNKLTGTEALRSSSIAPGPNFAGSPREWYETLVETLIDAANQIHKKTLRGQANFVVCGTDVATILEATAQWRAGFKMDADGQTKDGMMIGAEPVGQLSSRFTVFKDPYFPSNKILVGLKGKTFLEAGYVYAPYVPLILTPVVYGTDDFTPRKGIMTRYGKRMVRSDFYATVTVLDMGVR